MVNYDKMIWDFLFQLIISVLTYKIKSLLKYTSQKNPNHLTAFSAKPAYFGIGLFRDQARAKMYEAASVRYKPIKRVV